MNDRNVTRAIDVLLEQLPRLKREFWIEHGEEANTELAALSGGERRVYEAALSLWDGSRDVNLRDFLGGCDKRVISAFIQAIEIASKED